MSARLKSRPVSYTHLTYHTTDRELAEKIRAHKWYREGRITETIEEDEDVIHEDVYKRQGVSTTANDGLTIKVKY